ncbi:MAG: hypothetical protein JW394_1003 [Nitrospira sp.]|nr:hypothetical protein [Nitrospira sp.]
MDMTAAAIKSETLTNLARLRETPAFAWFMEKCVRPMHEEAERRLHDTRNIMPEQREIAAHVADALRQIIEWPDDQFTRNNPDGVQ